MSAAITAAAQDTTRQPRARVTIDWTDPFRDASLIATAADANRVSYNSQIADTVKTPPYRWFHLDGVTPLSTGTSIMPGTEAEAATNQVGWWSATQSDGSANFSAPVPFMTLEFSARPVYLLRVVGDDKWGEYPVDFSITVYNSSGIITRVDNITGNAAVEWTLDISSAPAYDTTKMTLSITKWSRANSVAKITEFFDSVIEVYEGDDIVSLSVLEESEVKNGSLPIGNISSNECDLELQNLEDTFFPDNPNSALSELVGVNRKISVELGFVTAGGSAEYEDFGVFWSGDWSMSEMGTTAKTSARDRMEWLRKSTYVPSEVYEGYTIYELIDDVLSNAQTVLPDLTYTIDTELDGSDFTVPFAIFERVSHFETLRRLCQAGMAFAYMSRADVLTVVGPTAAQSEEVSYYDITKNLYFDMSQPANTDEVANVIEVSTLPLTEAASPVQVYESKDHITILAGATDTIEVKYSLDKTEKGVSEGAASLYDASAGVTLDSAVYYSWGADITVSASIDGTFKLRVNGKKLTLDGEETVTARNETEIRRNGEMLYSLKENPLIQTREMAEKIADTLLASYAQHRKDIEVSWCGDTALQVGGDFRIPTYQKNGVDARAICKVTRQKIDFDGSLRVSTKGRKVRDGDALWAAYQDTDGAATDYQDTDNPTPSLLWEDSDEV